jgi:hypothetical protein
MSLGSYPVGLGGCKNYEHTLACCEYDVTVFDGKTEKSEILKVGGDLIRIHHGSIDESNSDLLQKYDGMTVLLDSDWSLKMLLSKIKEKSDKIRLSCVKSCLVDAAFYATKAKQGLQADPFAPAWTKCAAYFIADALVLYNGKNRSPTHMLEFIRRFQKNRANEFSLVAEAIGLERATPSLLERMFKSTVGFSDMTENNGHAKIIERKYQYLASNSLLSDCYFYLGYINKNNLVSIRDEINRRQELVHVLKTALDFEHDPTKIEQQANSLHNVANELICNMQEYT